MKKSMFNFRMKQRLLWLMLALLPVGIWAQDNSQAMLYVEKRDGTVEKFPIVGDYPKMSMSYPREYGLITPKLDITYFDGYEQDRHINSSDIKRMYTGFEAAGISVIMDDLDTDSEKVYTLGGRYVGRDSRRLESQPKGVYIVKKGVKYQKVVKP